jgi:hypothetical protein
MSFVNNTHTYIRGEEIFLSVQADFFVYVYPDGASDWSPCASQGRSTQGSDLTDKHRAVRAGTRRGSVALCKIRAVIGRVPGS